MKYLFRRKNEKVKKSLRKNTKMSFLETPANPTRILSDIEEICKIAGEIGALAVVDNTFATPRFQRALKLGADVVVHSSTKYMGGHADLLGGVIVGRKKLMKYKETLKIFLKIKLTDE